MAYHCYPSWFNRKDLHPSDLFVINLDSPSSTPSSSPALEAVEPEDDDVPELELGLFDEDEALCLSIASTEESEGDSDFASVRRGLCLSTPPSSEAEVELDLLSAESASSTTPSSESEADFASAPPIPLNIESEVDHITQTKLNFLITSLLTELQSENPLLRYNIQEEALLDCLHTHPVTTADVQLMLPSLNSRWFITRKLATNIGFFHALGRITSDEVEDMLTHILTRGDRENATFDRTTEQIERFKAEQKARTDRLEAKESSCAFLEKRRTNETKKIERLARRSLSKLEGRKVESPARYQRVEPFLPGGATSLAEWYTEGGDYTWAEVRDIQRAADATSPAAKKAPVHASSFSKTFTVPEWWATSRVRAAAEWGIALHEENEEARTTAAESLEAHAVPLSPAPVEACSGASSDHLFAEARYSVPRVCVPAARADLPVHRPSKALLSSKQLDGRVARAEPSSTTPGSHLRRFCRISRQHVRVLLPVGLSSGRAGAASTLSTSPATQTWYEHLIAVPRFFERRKMLEGGSAR